MAYWRIAPCADADDPRWLDFHRWEEVIVRADSAAMAILTASRELGREDAAIGNESPAGRAGFEDEKLYHVHRTEPAGSDPAAELDAGVVSAVPATAEARQDTEREGEGP